MPSERLKEILRQSELAHNVLVQLCINETPLSLEDIEAIDDAVCSMVVFMSHYGELDSRKGEPIGFVWVSNDNPPEGMSPGDTTTDPRTGAMTRLVEINKGMRLVYGWVPYDG